MPKSKPNLSEIISQPKLLKRGGLSTFIKREQNALDFPFQVTKKWLFWGT